MEIKNIACINITNNKVLESNEAVSQETLSKLKYFRVIGEVFGFLCKLTNELYLFKAIKGDDIGYIYKVVQRKCFTEQDIISALEAIDKKLPKS